MKTQMTNATLKYTYVDKSSRSEDNQLEILEKGQVKGLQGKRNKYDIILKLKVKKQSTRGQKMKKILLLAGIIIGSTYSNYSFANQPGCAQLHVGEIKVADISSSFSSSSFGTPNVVKISIKGVVVGIDIVTFQVGKSHTLMFGKRFSGEISAHTSGALSTRSVLVDNQTGTCYEVGF